MNHVPQDVRDAMVIEAWKLIAERGLEGMSTREVLARSGAPRGSVYHYFPRGRVQLIEAAIDWAGAWMVRQIDAIEAATAAELLGGYVDIWRRVVEATDFRAGCAVAGLVAGAQERTLLDRGASAFSASIDALARRLGQLEDSSSTTLDRARLLVCAVEGAVLMCRAQQSIEPLELVKRQWQRFVA